MKKILFISFLFATLAAASQPGIKGGWMECHYYYDYPGGTVAYYRVGIHVFNPMLPATINLSVFDAVTGDKVAFHLNDVIDVTRGIKYSNQFSTCAGSAASNNRIDEYIKDYPVTLPANPNGYLVTASAFGRDPAIINMLSPTGTGILLTTYIPGTINGMDYHTNTSPEFDYTDTVTVCRNTPFSCRATATDRNNDSLYYSFGDAIQAAVDTTSPPNLPVQYFYPYSGTDPLGNGASIDPVTGIISGISPPDAGSYTVAVYVQEKRNGIVINTTRKEFGIKVVECPFKKPLLKPVYSQCRVNTFTFKNEPTCPAITYYSWDFGDPNTLADTSLLPVPMYTYPPGPGTYTLRLKIKGANGYFDSATASVKILDSITVKLRSDTAICSSDTILLNPVSEGANYVWREIGGTTTLNNYNIENPKAFPSANSTFYYVSAQLNNCFNSAQIVVHASPYPKANAGPDTIICLGQTVRLQGQITGAYFTWNPITDLTGSNTLQPVANPSKNSFYVLAVRDTFYCPKTVRDTVKIKVVPGFTVDAGKDVNIVYGQPYQLQATTIGNTEIVRYQWSPVTFLNDATNKNPYATITNPALETMRYTLTAITVTGNCSATDDVVLHLFKTGPDILVPSGFTPNGDDKNDVLKPILIGIDKLLSFSVYNRFGQLVFTTTQTGKGWDGRGNGELQTTGSYVYLAKGIDYSGKTIERKGNILLIR